MNSRIHAVLDGDLPRCLLTADEEAELAELEASLDAAARWTAAAPVPAFGERVLNALGPVGPVPDEPRRTPTLLRAWRWLWTPRSLVLRPAAALAPAFALLVAFVAVDRPAAAPPAAVQAVSAPAPAVYVQFRLDAPGASEVSVAGSFTSWRPEHEMREAAPGVWTVLVPLAPGIHDYVFVVDGRRMVPDPAGHPVDDGFGGTNSRLYLAPSGGSA
ncbi:MAG: glycogen-binding domain-containing protein [Gemmatimonadetes bacterium]|nr:glycogen-binding domain-containing protein [Gemmatimonadota bacterium]